MKTDRSKKLFKEAQKLIPGGVNSPVRAFRAVGGSPLFIQKARGSKITDADGRSYVDFVMSWGALILGHAAPQVVKAVKSAAERGTSYGAPTQGETELAKIICAAIPSMKKVRLVNSGTEAAMSAIRLSRGFTGRDKIIKFEGCYHGHADSLLVKAGSGGATLGIPDSKGVTKGVSRDTIVCPYNDIEAFQAAVKRYGREIACVILEPVAANMGVVPADLRFLLEVRRLTSRYGIVLIFDEVIAGFRFHFGGVQDLLGIRADLTCLGKVIGGGLPIGAYGGRADIMAHVSPDGGVYQAGTLSGNPVAVNAGIAALTALKRQDYKALSARTSEFCDGLQNLFEVNRVPARINRQGSLFTVFFSNRPVTDFASAMRSDTKKFAGFFRHMQKSGISLPPSQFEACFVSFAHSSADLEITLRAAGAFRG